MRMPFRERVSRSVAKAVTFRILIILSDSVVIYLITRRFDVTLGVILASNIASTVLYFVHERIWDRINWGKRQARRT